jgi:hypothetical protein
MVGYTSVLMLVSYNTNARVCTRIDILLQIW